jgi:hypothetical protein
VERGRADNLPASLVNLVTHGSQRPRQDRRVGNPQLSTNLDGLGLVGLGSGLGDGADEPHAIGRARRRVPDLDGPADEPSEQLQAVQGRAISMSVNSVPRALTRDGPHLERAVREGGARAATRETGGRPVSEPTRAAQATGRPGAGVPAHTARPAARQLG